MSAMSEAEKIVWQVFEHVTVESDALYGTVIKIARTGFSTDLVPQYERFFAETKTEANDAVLAFTNAHLRKIAEKVEEIAWTKDRLAENTDLIEQFTKAGLPNQPLVVECKEEVPKIQRIISGLESELAALRRGVREEYQDGRMEGL